MFGDNLARFRKENNMSQELLAEMLGVTRQSVAKWESGRSYPEADKLIKLGSVFKVSIDKLLKSIEDDCDVDNISINNETSDDIIDFICKAKRETYATALLLEILHGSMDMRKSFLMAEKYMNLYLMVRLYKSNFY